MLIEIKNDKYAAVISSLGAELQSFRKNSGPEYIWEGKAEFWSGRSPVLFPIIGNLRNDTISIGGKTYTIPKHGLARRREFSVLECTEDTATFELAADEETLTHYPFLFSLRISYRFTAEGLRLDYQVINRGEQTMLYCFGTHPAFRCPLFEGERFEDYRISFNREETAKSLVFDSSKMEFNPENQVDVLENSGFDLEYSLFDRDALVFDPICSDAVRLTHREKGHGVELRFADFAAIGIWTPDHKKAPFVCLEPWNGMAVRSNEGDDFENKHLAKQLAPHNTASYYLEIVPIKAK